jgi:hypothetical protein
MTAYSLRILRRPPDATTEMLETPALKAFVVQNLGLHAELCGPYTLHEWAERREHPLYYVDNCWVRACVRGSDLKDFFAQVLRGATAPAPEIEPAGGYLIEAEEY